MAKTLKDFLNERQLGPMVVKNPDEQKFIDKHVVAKTDDRNGNDDELFKGSKVKMADRPKHRKGYNPGEDEEVYEELKGNQHKIDANKNGKVDAHDFHLLRGKKKKVAEEVEELEELSTDTLNRYKTAATADAIKAHRQIRTGPGRPNRRLLKRTAGGYAATRAIERQSKKTNEEAEQIDELSKETKASYMKKAGAEVDKLYDKSKTDSRSAYKYYGRKNTMKKIANEEVEELEELSKKTLRSYRSKRAKDRAGTHDELEYHKRMTRTYPSDNIEDREKAHAYHNALRKDIYKMSNNISRASAKIKKANEEAEQVDEKLDMKKASMGTVVKDFQKSDAPQFQGKSQKKRQVMAVAAKLTAERGGKPLNKEERLLAKLADISETHKRTMVSVFEKLNEDNQREFMLACDTAEGIEQMLDFSIQHRGE